MKSPKGGIPKAQEQVDAFWDRMDLLIGNEGISEFCRRTGVNEGTLHGSKHRKSMPRNTTLKDWAEKIGCNANWLITGDGDAFDDSQPSDPTPTARDVSSVGTDLDFDTLVASIETIEIYLSDNELILDSSNKAKAIASVYSIFISDMSKEQASRSIENLLALS